MKKWIHTAIALCVVLSLTVSAFAASISTNVEVSPSATDVNGNAVTATIERIPAPTLEETKDFAAKAVQTLTASEASAFQDAGLDLAADLGTAKMPLAASLDISVEEVPEGGAVFSADTGAKDGAAFFVVHIGANGVETTLAFSQGGKISFPLTNFSPVYIYAAPALDKTAATGTGTGTAAGTAGTVDTAGTPTAPKTGDATMLYAGAVLLLASAAAVTVCKKKA